MHATTFMMDLVYSVKFRPVSGLHGCLSDDFLSNDVFVSRQNTKQRHGEFRLDGKKNTQTKKKQKQPHQCVSNVNAVKELICTNKPTFTRTGEKFSRLWAWPLVSCFFLSF